AHEVTDDRVALVTLAADEGAYSAVEIDPVRPVADDVPSRRAADTVGGDRHLLGGVHGDAVLIVAGDDIPEVEPAHVDGVSRSPTDCDSRLLVAELRPGGIEADGILLDPHLSGALGHPNSVAHVPRDQVAVSIHRAADRDLVGALLHQDAITRIGD